MTDFVEGRSSHKLAAFNALAAYLLFVEGRSEFKLSRGFVRSEPWHDIAIEWQNEDTTDSFILRIIDKRRPRLHSENIEYAEYEIIDEATTPPPSPKLLPHVEHDSD